MNIATVILEAEKESDKYGKHIERLTRQLQDDLAAGRFPATNRLRSLASHRILHGLWAEAVKQLKLLDADADAIKASQLLRQIAQSALIHVLLPGDSSDGFTRALQAAEREGFAEFYREAEATADYIAETN